MDVCAGVCARVRVVVVVVVVVALVSVLAVVRACMHMDVGVDVGVRMCTVCVRGKRMPRSPVATFQSGGDRHQGPAEQRPIPDS